MGKNYDIVLIPAKYNKDITIPDKIVDRLPKKMMLFGSVQFLDHLPKIKKQLESKGKKIIMNKSRNYLYEGLVSDAGQLIGCNMENFSAIDSYEKFDAFLYIGDGIFHPKALLVNNEKDVYCFDPKTGKLNIIDKKEHLVFAKRKKGAQLKFLSSKNVGIIITTKKGQGSPKRAMMLRDKIANKWPDKKIFMFYANDINFQELENYNFIDIYVNVACPRIGQDDTIRSEKPIINISDVEELLKD